MSHLSSILLLWPFAVAALASGEELTARQGTSRNAPAKTVRLLTVGNSFSANATRYLEPLVKAAGHQLIHRPIVVGGASLELHAGMAARHAKDPADKTGLYKNGRSLRQELQADRWDFVTIQQASIKSHDLATYRPFAGELHATIAKHAPQARVLVHQTWAYRRDDPRFTAQPPKPGEPPTQEAMYQGLTAAYRAIAAELGAPLIPVGDAFHLADNDAQWGFRPGATLDVKRAKPPALPDQTHSLHVGWQWKKQKDGRQTLAMDGHHANTAGQYLGACVFYEVLFQESAIGNAFVPADIDPAEARFLQETAHRAVAAQAAAAPRALQPKPWVEAKRRRACRPCAACSAARGAVEPTGTPTTPRSTLIGSKS